MQSAHSEDEHISGESAEPAPAEATVPWWRRGVVYQVYVRSFADSNGDGTGDVNGLRSRLPYLRDLGIDAIWVNPWYRSPLADGGYDVADYREIEPRYGTVDDAALLISEAHEMGIKLITDVVPNHTSVEHRWFQEAIAAPAGHPSRERYHIMDGRGVDGTEPPTDWTSVFGGPAWSRLPDGQWYLHIFDSSQPDLNWENPEVLDEFESVLRFWLDRGADGFRVDVAHGLIKDMTWPDNGELTDELLGGANRADHPFWDRDGIHPIVRRWRALLNEYGPDRMMVAEAWVETQERLARYLRPDEYHQSFNFGFLEAGWDEANLRQTITSASTNAAKVGSTSTWVLSNHDVVRHATRLGLPDGTDWRRWLLEGPHDALDVELGLARARAATMLMLALPGSAYIYQGEELGLPEAWQLPVEVLDDPVWERSSHTRKGRDGCRVPLPWTADGPSFGFGDGDAWLPQPAEWTSIAAAVQAGDDASTLELYRSALAARRELFIADEGLTWITDAPEGVLAFRRGNGATCWTNMSSNDVELPNTPVLRSGGKGDDRLAPDQTAWFAG